MKTLSEPGPKAAAPSLPQGYTCCNLHYERDWINDGNYAQYPMIPAGTPAKVLSYGRYRANLDLNGKQIGLGQDYGRAQEPLEKFVQKYIVPTDPKPKIASYPADVREAIRLGKVMKGMTKEQVIVSIGYPMTSETPSLDSPVWKYWVSSFAGYNLLWDSNGRVREIDAGPTAAAMIVHQPARK
ncbi:MAG: hypothetical protein H0U63_00105 [Burkholderiales bacterium]|nr:hypothetical protein [Burkholderiales bacterium]